MLAIKLNQVILLLIFHVSNCQRRITNGETVLTNQRYVVYLLKSTASIQFYSGWMCGGSLVTSEFIVTSAACVTDVEHLYAIAGYNVYVPSEDIDTDECTKAKKKKIIFICVPKTYELKYEVLEKWSYIDIAVVKVESPYNLEDEAYGCSYTPQTIKINYETKYQEPGIDAIVFGWGHKEKWRSITDLEDYNQPALNYAPTLIQNKDECKTHYEENNGMADIIDSFMICTYEKGNINTAGDTIVTSSPTAEGCSESGKNLLKGQNNDEMCELELDKNKKSHKTVNPKFSYNKDYYRHEGDDVILVDAIRRNGEVVNNTYNYLDKNHDHLLNNEKYKKMLNINITHNKSMIDKLFRKNENVNATRRTRRNGICQNDHGGPLVTWVGAHEVLIGVASVFKVTEDETCTGPYLYTSTQCNGAFLDCILSNNDQNTPAQRRAICDSPASVKGFELIETHISWKDHPDGPADNERNSTETEKSTTNLMNNSTSNATNITTTTNQIKSEKEKINEEISFKHIKNLINTTILDQMIETFMKSTSLNPTNTTSTNHTNSKKERNYDYTSNSTTISISDLLNVSIPNFINTKIQNTTNTVTKNQNKNEKERNRDEINYNFTTIPDLTNVTITNLNTTTTNTTTTTFINLINSTTTVPSKFTTTASTTAAPKTTTLKMNTTITPSNITTALNLTNNATNFFTNTTVTNSTTQLVTS